MHSETTSLIELVGEVSTETCAASPRPQGLVGQLIGRQDELDRIQALVHRSIAGHGGIVVVEGEPGIGKTALLVAAARQATVSGMRIVRGEAKELEQRVPFAASASLSVRTKEQTTHSIGANFADIAIGREIAQVESLVAGLTSSCDTAPTMVIMDDAHWADSSTLLVLQRLGECSLELPILIVIAFRPLPREADLSSLIGQYETWGAEHLRLGPMSDTEVAALVEMSFGSPAGPRLSDLVSGAGGNPLYIIELVTGLMQDGMIELGEIRRDRDTESGSSPQKILLPESLTDVITRRLDLLPQRSRQILPMAAALGTGVEAIELSSILGAPVIEVWDVISIAVESGILVRVGADLIFRHDLIRQVLAEQLPPSTRVTLRQRAARVLISMDAPVERIATYLLAGDLPLDGTSLDWLIDVAERLTIRAPALAVSLLSRAIRTPGLSSPLREALRLWQVRALLWSGDSGKAESVARRALTGVPTSTDRETSSANTLQWLLAHACFAQGNLSDAVAIAEAVLAEPDLLPIQRGQYLGFSALTYMFQRRWELAEEASALAISTGEAFSDPVAWGLGSFALGLLRYQQGFLGEAQELGERLIQNYEHNGRRQISHIDPYTLSGRCHRELDEYTAAEKAFVLASRSSENTSGIYLGSIRLDMAWSHYLEGKWDAALADVGNRPEPVDIFGYTATAQCFIALVAVRRGTFTDDPALLPRADDEGGTQDSDHLRPWVHALVHESRGRSAEALEALSEIITRPPNELASVSVCLLYADAVRLAVTNGRHDIAARIASAAEVLDARHHTTGRRANAILCRGLAEGNVEGVAEAAECYRHAGQPWYEAHARENLAVLLVHGNRTPEARTELDNAIELYTKLEAAWDSARAEARMRDLGIRRGRRGPRNRPKTGWDALTPTERKVAALVAQGRSNSDIASRMFLSPRTIQSHVSSILVKLSLQSRVQVAIRMAQQSS